MNKVAHYNGFVGRCQQYGLTKQAADMLYKRAQVNYNYSRFTPRIISPYSEPIPSYPYLSSVPVSRYSATELQDPEFQTRLKDMYNTGMNSLTNETTKSNLKARIPGFRARLKDMYNTGMNSLTNETTSVPAPVLSER